MRRLQRRLQSKKKITADIWDYSEVEAFLIGECGRTVQSAMLVSVEEYMHLVSGHAKRMQHQYEVARFLAYHVMMLSPYIKPGRRPATMQKYITFPWERSQGPDKPYIGSVSDDDVVKLSELFADFLRRHEQSR